VISLTRIIGVPENLRTEYEEDAALMVRCLPTTTRASGWIHQGKGLQISITAQQSVRFVGALLQHSQSIDVCFNERVRK
jgi:hypothetical protein